MYAIKYKAKNGREYWYRGLGDKSILSKTKVPVLFELWDVAESLTKHFGNLKKLSARPVKVKIVEVK